jgi:hypothetical protein
MNKLDLFLGALASPVYGFRGIVRLKNKWKFLKMSYTPAIQCRNCGERIMLLGNWRCSCKFTYRGHLLRACPVCHSLPAMVRCFACGITERLPQP